MLNQPLRLDEGYFERIWGGRTLETKYHKSLPAGVPIGEAWLVSDHPQFTSTVSEGPAAGETLRTLMEQHAEALLGRLAQPTPHGRFPLLLKLLDAQDVLSVQVHPDDALARELNEPDAGKTEMWHVLEAVPGAELICGLAPEVTPEQFAESVDDGSVGALLERFPAPPGTTAFVAAGTVHAIGAGLLLAEIQQNSDITYRIYDWGRVDSSGKPRELHIDKARQVTRFGKAHGGAARTLAYTGKGATCEVLGACRYFAGERVSITDGEWTRNTRGDSFHLLLAVEGKLLVGAGEGQVAMAPGQVALVPGQLAQFRVAGRGTVLDYYVPDIDRDIWAPLRAAGHSDRSIRALGGRGRGNDLG